MTKVEYNKALKVKESTILKEESTKCKFYYKSRVYSTDEYKFRKAFNEVLDGLVRKQIRRARSSRECQ